MARRYCKPAEFSNENDKPYLPGTPNTITLGNWGLGVCVLNSLFENLDFMKRGIRLVLLVSETTARISQMNVV
jgi:hypothetical protein